MTQQATIDLLKEVETALNDWVVLYAPDFCENSDLLETARRISANGGTLAYITNLRERVEAARKEMEK